MTGKEYQELAMRTNDGKSAERLLENALTCDMKYLIENNLIFEDEKHFDLGGILNASLGLSGEVGELNDMIKKWIFHNHNIDIIHVKKEIGDIMWYIAMMCESFDITLDEVMQMNVDKLKARYPDGFDVDRSKNRVVGDI